MRRRARWLAVAALLVALAPGAHATDRAMPPAADVVVRGAARSTGDPAGGSRLQGVRDSAGTVAPAAVPRDYVAEARAGFGPVSRAYNGTRVVVRLLGPLYGILCGLLLMFTGLSARFRNVAIGLGHRRYVRVLVYFSLYAAAMFVLGLPLAWYEEYALEHQYGFSTQTLGGWLVDSVKGLVFWVVAIGVIPVLSLAWRMIEKWPRRWWLWIAAGTLPMALAGTLLEPLVFDPLFNQFTPLQDAELRREILALGARAGIPAHQVYQVDMSARTTKINAYVNGFGASQRIVLWDTTLRRMKRDEILFVMGHEMGHYVLAHVWQSVLLVGIGAFGVFWLCSRITAAWLAGFGHDWGVSEAGDLAAMPVIALSLTLVTLLAMPLVNAIGREVEHQADVYGLELTRDNDAAARAFLTLAQDNRSDPEPAPWVRFLLFDHPPLAERIRFALEYRPWERGAPNRYYRPR